MGSPGMRRGRKNVIVMPMNRTARYVTKRCSTYWASFIRPTSSFLSWLLCARLDVDQDLLERAPPGVRDRVRVVRLREIRPVGAVGRNRGRNIHHVDVFHVLDHLLDDLPAGVD